MKLWQFSFGMRLWLIISLSGFLGTVATEPGLASEKLKNTNISQLGNIKFPATSAQMLVQQPAPTNATPGEVITITGVRANPTDKGVEVVLETAQGEKLQVTNRSTGNNFIADITGGQLRLPDGNAFTFKSEKPIEGITEITVANIDANTVRITVVGEKALPAVELFDDNVGLIFAVASTATAAQEPEKPATQKPEEQPAAQQDEPIELVVTGERDGYRVPNTSVGTRTDTPLRDIPQSIQVVPQEVLRDQNVTTYNEALRNVPGVAPFNSSTTQISNFIIRGFLSFDFASNLVLRNGLREAGGLNAETTPDIERIEVLLGPASVLYGAVNPGGTINLVTKQPLRDPFYAVDATIGSYDFYRGAIDLSGPLNDSRTVLYRLNASYLVRGSFIDFVERDQFTIAPVVSVAIGERTSFTLEGEYTQTNETNFTGLPAVGTVLPNPNGRIPRNRFVGNPDFVLTSKRSRVGYRLQHEFSDNWSLQNAFQARFFDRIWENGWRINTSLDPDNRTLNGELYDEENDVTIYDLNTNLTGRFSTGSIEHQLVFGVDLGRYEQDLRLFTAPAVPLDVFNPVYGQPFAGPYRNDGNTSTVTDTLGIYIQDQVTLAPNLKLLLGGRFDLFEQITQDLLTDTRTSQSGNAFSPRVGIVYQPIEPISLYASYSRSFNPVTGTAFDGSPFQPERGTQYEVGIKADLNDQLSTTLAFYDLTRTNVLTTDPDNPNFSIQTGEQRSQGIELRVQGEILPGWNILAGYAYTDARITQDNTFPVGNRLNGVPENAFNLWTSYEIQQGTLQGLGFGLGLFYVGGRQVDLDNSVELPSYLRTDAAIFYRRDQFRAALNFRNLFNVDYFESTFSPLTISYGEPFAVQGTISWQF
ncbi:TonB-dependent siderophore receptor [Chlorogloeopsis fritschii PCC 9212]|uniref:Ferrichrome-iron receptor n=1 Tax=Chlorogloeopsis fritschii PCC 6912 TaxID=211165 RepID=A0A433MVZ0_CHLFR|nr:TonB-dependent siderophore receptor [Chlorogloeopsis fritschii]RUR72024.1 ferrichrome-iron receptor [Chlorogloeopsis fritschii PCC 6912]